MLGVKIDSAYKNEILRSVQGDIVARKRRKAQREEARRQDMYELPFDQDDNFFYIAGYTNAGFAYGVTWEEWEQQQENFSDAEHNILAAGSDEPDDIPF